MICWAAFKISAALRVSSCSLSQPSKKVGISVGSVPCANTHHKTKERSPDAANLHFERCRYAGEEVS